MPTEACREGEVWCSDAKNEWQVAIYAQRVIDAMGEDAPMKINVTWHHLYRPEIDWNKVRVDDFC